MTEEKKKNRNTRNIIIIVVGVILLVASPFLLCLGLGIWGASMEDSYESDYTYEEASGEEEESSEELLVKSTYPESVDLDGVIWTIDNVEDIGDTIKYVVEYDGYGGDADYSDYDCVSESGKYIVLDITVKNDSSSPVSIYEQSLYSIDGDEYWATTDTYYCLENEMSYYEDINPGMSFSFEVAYEVPTEDNQFKYIIKDPDYSEKDGMINIDLR
jgi:hypothetical protein